MQECCGSSCGSSSDCCRTADPPPSSACCAVPDPGAAPRPPTPPAPEAAYARGLAAGHLAGHATALQDGARLGRLHGTALCGELGALEGLTRTLAALQAQPPGPEEAAAAAAGPAAAGAAAPRLRRAAAQVQELVAGLAPSSGAPLPAQTDCVDLLLRCRVRAKACCAASALPPTCASLAGWGLGSAAAAGSQPAATPAGCHSALDF